MKAEKPRHKAGDSLNTNTGVGARQQEEREPKEEAGKWVCHGPFGFSTSFTFSQVGPLRFTTELLWTVTQKLKPSFPMQK